uniref:Protein transport protein BOS1 n=1 Tax=Blastobotrys adeninivorans TaxID=409370 RepID=A0A060T5L8_BLAAD
MNSLYNHAVKQSQSLKKDLDQFAQSPESAPLSLQGQISATLTSFSRTVDDYASAAKNEIVAERTEKANQRIEAFRKQIVESREQFKRLKQQREESIHSTAQQELFGRRAGRHPQQEDELSENPYSHSASPSGMSRGEGLEREGDVLARAGHQIDEFIERGRQVLTDLGEQSSMLQNTQKAIYSVGNTLGLSNETIRMAERRAREDKWIFYGGVLFMFVCFYYIIKWFR